LKKKPVPIKIICPFQFEKKLVEGALYEMIKINYKTDNNTIEMGTDALGFGREKII